MLRNELCSGKRTASVFETPRFSCSLRPIFSSIEDVVILQEEGELWAEEITGWWFIDLSFIESRLTEKTKYNIYHDFRVMFTCNKSHLHVGKNYPKLEVMVSISTHCIFSFSRWKSQLHPTWILPTTEITLLFSLCREDALFRYLFDYWVFFRIFFGTGLFFGTY